MVIYHPYVQKDLSVILTYYETVSGAGLADRFFETFLKAVSSAEEFPERNHPAENPVFRRATVPGFPYHFLFRTTSYGIRVSVLKHDRRDPKYGRRRK